jgi:hypothetical protein
MQFTYYSNNISAIIDYLVGIFNLSSNKYVQISKAYSGSTILVGYVAP